MSEGYQAEWQYVPEWVIEQNQSDFGGERCKFKYEEKHKEEEKLTSDNNDCTATRPADVSPKSPDGDFVQS